MKEWEIETGREGGREREQNRQRWEEGTEVEKEGVGWKYSENRIIERGRVAHRRR